MLSDFRVHHLASASGPEGVGRGGVMFFFAACACVSALMVASSSAQQEQATVDRDAPAADTAELPDGTQVLEDFITAIGGRDAYKKMRSLRMKGELNIPAAQIVAPLTVLKAAPNKFLLEIDMGDNGRLIRGTNGEIAWQISPDIGPQDIGARLLAGDEKEEFLREADFDAQLHPEKHYKSIECVGQVEFDGQPAYDVELVDAKGNKELHTYDAQTHLLLRIKAVRTTQMGRLDAETTLSDYRDVNGVKHPFQVEVNLKLLGLKQIMKFVSLESNIEIADDAFEPPQEISELLSKEGEDSEG